MHFNQRMVTKEGGTEENQLDLNLLHKYTIEKINYIKSKPILKDVEVYHLIWDFFKEFLSTDNQFTHEELIEAISQTFIEKELYEQLVTLIRKIGKIEYTGVSFSREDLLRMLDDFQGIIKVLLYEFSLNQEAKKSKSFSIKSFFTRKANKNVAEVKFLKLRFELLNEVNEIKSLIFRHQKNEAIEKYLDLRERYSKLVNLDLKKEIYSHLVQIYNLLNQN